MRIVLTVVTVAFLISIAAMIKFSGWFDEPQVASLPQAANPPVGAYQTGDRLEEPATDQRAKGGKGELLELGWGDLLPADWLSDEWLDSLNLEEMEDEDPRAREALDKILAEWENAPVVEELDGQLVRIPGFVVTLEGDGRTISEFLLVPYFGACVHVPPPPPNQLIHILPQHSIPGDWDMTPVWVVGELTATRIDSALGSAGYQLKARSVEAYEDELPQPAAPH
jgi:uncharacterized protein